ncbi:hypothetical protein QR680_017058 [Steinernema hermaphroditum]|uniref:Uncharacterized protein n=1 Tax=Steinernema hermaphroditum TaxID=289476 RepID=A0AA39LNB6_9BILA|nr:hypothetical protein QR680_017058 [Steinernema hermaphroditum]
MPRPKNPISKKLVFHLTQKNYNAKELPVCVVYPFVSAHFPELVGSGDRRTNYEKNIRSELSKAPEIVSERNDENNKCLWGVLEASKTILDAELDAIRGDKRLRKLVETVMARPEILDALFDGSWGPFDVERRRLPQSSKEIEDLAKRDKEGDRRRQEMKQKKVLKRRPELTGAEPRGAVFAVPYNNDWIPSSYNPYPPPHFRSFDDFLRQQRFYSEHYRRYLPRTRPAPRAESSPTDLPSLDTMPSAPPEDGTAHVNSE